MPMGIYPTFSTITTRAQDSARLQEVRNAMVEYISEQKGVIADDTEFYYFEEGLPKKAGEVKPYMFNYKGGKLEDAEEITVTVTESGEEGAKTYTYKIGNDTVVFAETANDNVFVKTTAPANP